MILLYKATEHSVAFVTQGWGALVLATDLPMPTLMGKASGHCCHKTPSKQALLHKKRSVHLKTSASKLSQCFQKVCGTSKTIMGGPVQSFVYTSLLLSLRKTSLNVCAGDRVCQKGSATTNLTNQGRSATQKLESGVATTKKSHILGNDARASGKPNIQECPTECNTRRYKGTIGTTKIQIPPGRYPNTKAVKSHESPCCSQPLGAHVEAWDFDRYIWRK